VKGNIVKILLRLKNLGKERLERKINISWANVPDEEPQPRKSRELPVIPTSEKIDKVIVEPKELIIIKKMNNLWFLCFFQNSIS